MAPVVELIAQPRRHSGGLERLDERHATDRVGHWEALTRFCDDGCIEIDDNTAERSIRPLVLGRRNYLFAGSDSGGTSAAALYNLIGTVLLNGAEPYTYLRELLGRIAEHPINRIDELLPWHLDLKSVEDLRQAA